VENGRVSRVGPEAGAELASSEQARVINGEGRWLLPGFVDLHVHFREPGQEYKEDIRSGLAAAARGGYSHVCAMANTKPVNDNRAVTELMLARAREADSVNLHPIGAITKGLKGKELTEMAELKEAGAVGVSDDGVCVMSSQVMRRALEYAKNFDLPVIQHAEDHDLTEGADMHEGPVSTRLGLRGWPRVAEDIIVARDILLAEYVRARYHVAHMSTEGAVRLVQEAKSRNLEVTSEVTPHHLLLTDASVLGYDTHCKVNPPLREERDVQALRKALANGTIDAIATDHAPHSPLEKDCEFSEAANGIQGLELCFGLLSRLIGQDGLTLNRLAHAMSTGPARIARLEAPSFKLGSVFECALFDPNFAWSPRESGFSSKSRNTPFIDEQIRGKVQLTTARGAVVFEDLAEAPRATAR
jgi:dihydroorotase